MINPKIAAGFLFLGFLWGCQTIRVTQDYDPARDLASLERYQWRMEEPPETGDILVDNPLLHERIHAAIDRTLSNNGYRRVPGGEADFHVSYKYGIRREIDPGRVGFGLGFGWGSFGRFGGIGVDTAPYPGEYDEWVLAIDLKDENGNLLWRGVGTDRFDQYDDPEETTERVNTMVEKILSRFPP